jgi:hypothetical protein
MKLSVLSVAGMKMAAFCVAALWSPVKVTDVSEMLAASIIRGLYP